MSSDSTTAASGSPALFLTFVQSGMSVGGSAWKATTSKCLIQMLAWMCAESLC